MRSVLPHVAGVKVRPMIFSGWSGTVIPNASSHRLRPPKGGHCRVRVYLPEADRDAPVVLCSELLNNAGLSVTKAAEVIAAKRSSPSTTYRFRCLGGALPTRDDRQVLGDLRRSGTVL
jgi:hypothetical protein